MCYTSGTTGRPKGVLYSHRSIVLHTLGAALPDSMGIREADSVMPVVPMFHAMAWGIPYVAAMLGREAGPARVPTSPREGLAELIATEGVTWTAGVPTIWNGLLELDPPPDLSRLRELKAGGSAVPEPLIRAFDERFGVPMVQGWGMTETSPLAAVSRLPAGVELSERRGLRAARLPGPGPAAGRVPHRRGRGRRAPGPRPVDRAAPTTGIRAATRSSPTTAGCAPATSPSSSDDCVHPARRPDQGPGQVGRRVDLLGRARERRHGPPRRGRGRRDRRPRRALGRATVRLRRAPRGPRRRRRRPPGAPRRAGGEVVDPGAHRVHRRGARRPRSASSTRSSFAPGSRAATRRSVRENR